MSEKDKTEMSKTEMVKFRITPKDKAKLLSHFGSYSAVRDYVLKALEDKGQKRNEVNK